MIDYAFYNGQISPYEKTAVSLCDRSIFFGDGVYDVIVGYGNRLYQKDEHLKRLLKNAEILSLKHEYDSDKLSEIIL